MLSTDEGVEEVDGGDSTIMTGDGTGDGADSRPQRPQRPHVGHRERSPQLAHGVEGRGGPLLLPPLGSEPVSDRETE